MHYRAKIRHDRRRFFEPSKILIYVYDRRHQNKTAAIKVIAHVGVAGKVRKSRWKPVLALKILCGCRGTKGKMRKWQWQWQWQLEKGESGEKELQVRNSCMFYVSCVSLQQNEDAAKSWGRWRHPAFVPTTIADVWMLALKCHLNVSQWTNLR